MRPIPTSGRLYNEDLAPVRPNQRTWGIWHFAALWVGMAVCIPTYTMAAGLIAQGLSWWQSLCIILLGNVIVLVPLTLNAHAGTRYGIPFPVLLRSSFGTLGANIPAMMRALVACGWFGIQTWIGGEAIYTLLIVLFGASPATPTDTLPFIGLSPGQLGCFLAFWALNMAVVAAGIQSIRRLESWAAPALLAMGALLLWWGVREAGGFTVMFSADTLGSLRGALPGSFDFWVIFWPSLTAVVGFWATLSLNIPDFTRYARRQKDQFLGQLIGLPATMTLFSFIGIAVTCATVVVFGEAIWDPVVLLGRFSNPFTVCFALFALALATLSTNIAANVVSPANDFSNLWPRRISFRMGGLITGVLGILIMPWRLYTDLSAYLFTWLIGYGTILGAIAGIMLIDYHVIRRRYLDVGELYSENGIYSYGSGGVNVHALVAMIAGIAPCIPGFMAQAFGWEIPAIFDSIYTYGWFVSLAISGIVYASLMALRTSSTHTTHAS